MQPSARAWITAMAVCVSLAFAAQSCGTISSSDCAARATCSEETSGGSGGGDSGGQPQEEASDDGSGEGASDDGMAQDVAIDNEESSDGTGPDVAGDVAGDGVSMGDVTNEHDASADVVSDVSSRDAISEKAPGDVCLTTESCTNGIDDNCDGKIDCADPLCAAYTCAPVAPAGWTGPALLWTGAYGATAPSCPAGYHTINANAGPTGTADKCNCTCASSGQTCSAVGALHPDQTCNTSACASVTLSASGAGACTPIAANSCGTGGSFVVGTVPAPSGGNCAPQVTKTAGSAPGWTSSARVCSWTAPPDVPSGCAVAGDQCVPANPGTFVATTCVYQSADIACPATYPTKTLVYAGETDSRGCGACTCSPAPSGGSCGGSISIWPDQNANCSGAPGATYTLGAMCLGYSGMYNNPGYAQANFTVTGGACTVTAQPTPTGAVTGTGPMTVCCQ